MANELLDWEIRRKLAALRRTLRRRLAGEGLGWIVLGLVAVVFVSFGLDRLFHLAVGLRVAVLAACLGGVVYVAGRFLVRPMRVPMRRDQVALLLEDRYRCLGDRLISAIQLSDAPPSSGSPAMIRKMAAEANELARPLDIRAVVDARGLRRALVLAAAAVALLLALGIWQGEMLGLWFRRNLLLADEPWPQRVYLTVLGDDFHVIRDENLPVEAVLEERSELPEHVTLHATLPSVGATQVKMKAVPGDPRRYRHVFERVTEPFEFYVIAGDDKRDERRPHRVIVVQRPSLTAVDWTFEPPQYLPGALAPLRGQGVPVGSTITLSAAATKDLRPGGARLHLDCGLLRQQRGLREALARLRDSQRELCEKLAAAERALRGGRGDAGRAELARCADKRKGLAKELGELAGRQAGIVEAVAKNPPGAREAALAGPEAPQVAALRTEVLPALEALSRRSAQIDDTYLAGGRTNEEAAALLQWIEQVRPAHVALQTALAKAAVALAAPLKAAEQYLGTTALEVAADGRGVSGTVYVWGPNRGEVAHLTVVLEDVDGVANDRALRTPVRLVEDRAPTVKAEKRGLSERVTARARIPLEIELADDHGLEAARMVLTVETPSEAGGAGEERRFVEDLMVPAGEARPRFEHVVDLQVLGSQAEAESGANPIRELRTLRITVEADDGLPGKFGGPNVGASGTITLKVVPVSELWGELIQRRKQARTEFEQAIMFESDAAAKMLAALQVLDAGQAPQAATKLKESAGAQAAADAECLKVHQGLSSVLEEMVNNRVGEREHHRALGDTVEALTGLRERQDALATSLEALRAAASLNGRRAEVAGVLATQQELLTWMKKIRESMIRAESREELANSLQRLREGWGILIEMAARNE